MVSNTIQQVNFDILHPLFLKVGRANLIISAIAFIITAMISSTFMVLSVVIGTVIGITNLSILAWTVKSGFLFKPDKAQRFVMKRYYIKLIATIFIVSILVSKNLADPVGLIIGFSITMITTLTSAIYFSKHVPAGIKQGKEAV